MRWISLVGSGIVPLRVDRLATLAGSVRSQVGGAGSPTSTEAYVINLRKFGNLRREICAGIPGKSAHSPQ